MRRFFVLFIVVIAMLATSSAYADETPYGVDRRIGIGVEFAHGPGLSLKFARTPGHSLQFGFDAFGYGRYREYSLAHGHDPYVGYDFGLGGGGFLMHLDSLNNLVMFTRNGAMELPFYLGGGADLGVGNGGPVFGLHANLGVALQFAILPFDIFGEWTPRLWIVDFLQFHPSDFNAGVRVWF